MTAIAWAIIFASVAPSAMRSKEFMLLLCIFMVALQTWKELLR